MDINQYIDDGMNSARSDINNPSGTSSDRNYNLKDHFNSCNNSRVLGSYKARKYIFRRQDKKHPGYYEGKHTDIEKLEYFMGTSCGLLNTNQYEFYCKLAGRDVKYKEVSRLGVPSTVYEIKHERKKYSMLHPVEKKNEKKKVLLTSIGTPGEEKEKFDDLKKEYLEDKTRIFNKIEKSLEAQRYVYKKSCKKFERFRTLAMAKSDNLHDSKLNYFLKKTVSLMNGPRNVNVYRVNIREKPGSPYIYGIAEMNRVEKAPLVEMLVDSGSDISLINERMLEHMGIDTNEIQPSVSYSIQSSSDLVRNATIGKITINMHLVSRSGALVKTRIPFIVAHEKLELNKIILGDTFLNKQLITIQYRGPLRPRIEGEFYTNVGPRKVLLRVKVDQINCKIKLKNNQIEFTPDAVMLDTCFTTVLPDKDKGLGIPDKIELPPQVGIGTTDDGRPFLTNADSFLVDCIAEDDGKIHEIQLSPDYRACDSPFTAHRSELERPHPMNIHPDLEQRDSSIPEKESGCKAEINIHSQFI